MYVCVGVCVCVCTVSRSVHFVNFQSLQSQPNSGGKCLHSWSTDSRKNESIAHESILLVFGPIYLVGNQVLINKHSLMIRILVYDLQSHR